MDIQELVKPNIRSLRAYHAEEVPCKVKLDANESPYSAISLGKNLQTLNRYPDPQATALRKLMVKGLKVKPENILHGNGSDELISYMITTFGGPVMYPVPTFSMYGIISQALDEKKIEIPLDKDFDIDIEKTITAIKKYRPKLIFLSSPNNPTGNCFSPDKIKTLIEKSQGLVVIDEAYGSFSGKTLVPWLKKYDNLVILKTLSKVGLAAMRTGFLIGAPHLINELDKIRLPYNINSLSQVAAGFYLDHMDLFSEQTQELIKSREELFNALQKIEGIKPSPSKANFIFFSCDFDTDSVYRGLIQEGVLIKNLNSPGVLRNCMRVTVGTREENEEFLKALKKVLFK